MISKAIFQILGAYWYFFTSGLKGSIHDHMCGPYDYTDSKYRKNYNAGFIISLLLTGLLLALITTNNSNDNTPIQGIEIQVNK